MGYRETILDTAGLVGYWRLGEFAGPTAIDETGAHSGTYNGTPGFGVPGALGAIADPNTAVQFNSDWINVPHHVALNLGDRWSVTAWIKPDSVTRLYPHTILSKGDNAYNARLANDGRLQLVRSNDAVLIDTTSTVAGGVWQHVAFVKGGAHRRLYINGVDRTATVINPAITEDNGLPLIIGADADAGAGGALREDFQGGIDELALFNRPLTALEIYRQYLAAFPEPPLPPARPGIARLTGGAVIEICDGYSGSWSEVTCQIISAKTVWGSLTSEGLLTQAKPGLTEFELYDPERLLDPTNTEGAYYDILRPGLWVRLSYDDGATRTVISHARADTIDHEIVSQTGRIRANDWVSWFANQQFPNDVLGTLSDWTSYFTAHSFAKAVIDRINAVTAIDGFQLPVTVETELLPSSIYITPQETPFEIGNPGPVIWSHFTDMVEAQLYYVWVDRANVLRFRDKKKPGLPGIKLGTYGPLVLNFGGLITAGGVLNLIEDKGQTAFRQDRRSVDEWGIRSYRAVRTWPNYAWSPSTEAEWLDLLISDRATPSLQALPFQIWPATPNELKQLIAVPAMDLMTMQFDVPTPPVNLFARCIGGQISVDAEGWSVELMGWVVPEDQLRFGHLL